MVPSTETGSLCQSVVVWPEEVQMFALRDWVARVNAQLVMSQFFEEHFLSLAIRGGSGPVPAVGHSVKGFPDDQVVMGALARFKKLPLCCFFFLVSGQHDGKKGALLTDARNNTTYSWDADQAACVINASWLSELGKHGKWYLDAAYFRGTRRVDGSLVFTGDFIPP